MNELTCTDAIQINWDSREQSSEDIQANEMLCLLFRHDKSWPKQNAWKTMNDVTLFAPGEHCDFDLVDLEAV